MVILHLILVALNYGLLVFLPAATALYWAGALTTLVYAYVSYKEMRAAPLVLSPLALYFLWSISVLGLPPMLVSAQVADLGGLPFAGVFIEEADLVYANWLATLGSLGLHLGMEILRPHQLGSPRPGAVGHSERAFLYSCLIWWFGGVLVRLFREDLAFLGALRGLFAEASAVVLFAYVCRLRIGRSLVPILVVGTAVELYFGIKSGMKTEIMKAFLPLMWWLLQRKETLKYVPIFGAILVAFYFFFVQPIVTVGRTLTGDVQGATRPETILDTLESDAYKEMTTVESGGLVFGERQFLGAPIGFIVSDVRIHGLRLGETMEYLWYSFIPRLVWPEKPTVTQGGWFTTYLGNASRVEDASSSTGITMSGELFWNFGLLGLVVGMLFLGGLSGIVWRLCGEGPGESPTRLVVFVSLALGVAMAAEAGVLLVSLVVSLLVLFSLISFESFLARQQLPALVSPQSFKDGRDAECA